MASKQIGGDSGLPENLAGMTKSQLYDIMSQMKTLIDQNHQQARDVLIRNPLLTKALFQAQIMLGMVQPPQVIPKVEPQVVQQSHQSVTPKLNGQPHMSSVQSGGVGLQEPAATMQQQAPVRKHPMPQPMTMPPPPPPPTLSATNNTPSQPRFSHPQRQGHLNPAGNSLSHPQSSQVQSVPPPVPLHQTSQQQPRPYHHLDIPASSTQVQQQQPMHSDGGPHLAQQQPRPYHHQYGPAHTNPNAGFQHHGAPPQHHSQPIYHSGNRPPASGGPQFPQGQQHMPNQSLYQGGGQFRGDYNNNQLGGPLAADRGSSWMAGQSESPNITHLPGLGPVPPPSQVGPGGGPPPRSAPIPVDTEKQLLQQVMNLTQEQINLLPPDQRSQVFQLQQILRQ